ncbi:MAG: relaxase/mobilization nuclease domain-containing protein [Lachnospiraceae bacterium]|nr:relaxase/mobilization nuclease domain-containing protein [Lachnospiraceae bacterium]
MATTKIWAIHQGSSMNVVIDYVENPDKITEMVYVLEGEGKREYTYEEHESMIDVMEYAMNDFKTEERRLVSGVNVSIENARDEMMLTKRQYGKEEGIILWHGYQSFKPGEVTPEEAHLIGVELAQNLWGNDHEVIVCTHIDKEHIHNHFVINSVSFRTGKKLDAKWQDMARESDRLCEMYGKSVIENPQFKGKHYAQYQAEKKGEHTWLRSIQDEVDEIIDACYSIDEFYAALQKRGYSIKVGKYLTLKPPRKERGVKIDRHLGDRYSVIGITERIETNVKNGTVKIPTERGKRVYRCNNRVRKPTYRKGGYQGLYYFYCYKLGVLPKRKVSTKQTHYLLREELFNIDKISRETRFLARNNITTAGDLKHYEDKVNLELKGLQEQRRILYNRSRYISGEELEKAKGDIDKLNGKINEKKRELGMVKDIKMRSEGLSEKARTVRETNKETRENEKEV